MSGKGKKGEEAHDEQEDCASDTSLSESSPDTGSDYLPETSSEPSDSEHSYGEGYTELRLKNKLQHMDKTLQFKDSTDAKDGQDKMDEVRADDSSEEEVTESKITVKSCASGQKRTWDKRHYCVYCKKPQSKMARHLKRKHSKEKEVALAMNHPQNSKKSRQMFEALRRKGNYHHNIEVLKKEKGEIVTYRQPTKHVDPEKYLPCSKCFGFFIKNELWKHESRCGKKTGEPTVKSKQKRRVQSAASSLLPYRGQASQRCSEVVSKMVIDEVSHKVKSDPLICEFGDRLLQKYGSDRSKDGYVSQKMRELGRFVLAAKSISLKVKKLQDVLVPPHFKLAVEAAKKASGFTNTKYRYDTPSLAIKLGHSLKTACNIMIGQHVKDEDEAAAVRVRNFSGLLDAEWHLFVSRRARTNLEEDRWNKRDMIPLTQDVMELNNVLKCKMEAAKKELLDGPSPGAYRTFSECLLSQIILFNRRRQGEAAKIPLLTYKNRVKDKPNDDIMACLSKLEKNLSNEFTRLVVRGKRGRKVPVLFTKEMTQSMDFLIEHRNEDNNILDQNEYVFARQNSESHLRGSDCLRKYAAVSGAKRPETLTSTHLRKHVATLSQIMNLKDNELDQLAKFMGHDIRVHREYYRLTENTLQLAKISKLLMAIECGTHAYKGKSLDEIDLGFETPPPSLDVQVSGVSENDMDSSVNPPELFPQLDEEVASLTSMPPDTLRGTQGMGSIKEKRSKRVSELFPVSDDDSDTVTQRSPTKLRKTHKTGLSKKKMSKRVSEPVQDSDEEMDHLTSTPVSPDTRKKTGTKEKKRSKSVSEPFKDSDEGTDILAQRTDELQMTQETGVDSPSPPSQKCHRRPWKAKEKEAVWRQLGKFITLFRVPGKEHCVKALKAEPVLFRRDWKDVKNQVHNTIVSLKRKQS